jgi:osmotically-inducible protein OsmY
VNLGTVANLARPAPPDWDIKAQIEKRLASHDQLSNVQVGVENGVVTLTGTVPTADWRKTAQMISKLEGVRSIVNKIEVR